MHCLRALSLLSLLAGANAQAQVFPLPAPGNDLVGTVSYTEAVHADTLLDIARRHDLGYEAIRHANPTVDAWLPGGGTRVLLPTRYILPNAPREGIVINVAEMRLYYFPKPKPGYLPMVESFPISVGRSDWNTPLSTTSVTGKVTDPAWYPPESIRAEHASDGEPLPTRIAPGDDNPLGRFALRLGLSSYLIHGTNKDFGIGMQVTHGCIRLYPEDIAGLFYNVPVGTPVRIVNQPYKAGWENGALYLEVHPLLDGTPAQERQNKTPLVQALIDATRERPQYPIDWREVQLIEKTQSGLPTRVGPAVVSAGTEASR
jgi:L,D-transpeptidase ErfK/SrfK